MRWTIIILLSIMNIAANAQQISGVVMDAENNKYLADVLIINKRTQQYAYSSDSGYYRVRAERGDTIVYMAAAYHTMKRAAGAGSDLVKLKRLSYSLDEVEILPELEKFEQEHKEMLHTYNKSFTDAKRKPTAFFSNGLVIGGLFTEAASRISGQKKKDKRFLETFNEIEEQKYIALRYNPEVVMSTVRTNYDSAVSFINANPMEVGFAKEATSLELLMWIRHHYNLWANNEKERVQPAKGTD